MDISKRIVSEDSLKVIEQWKDCQAYYHSLCVPRDSEILGIIELLDQTRKSWLNSVEECNRLKLKVEKLECERRVADVVDSKLSCDRKQGKDTEMVHLMARRSVSDSNLLANTRPTPKSRVKIPMGSTFDMRSPLSANNFWTKGRPIAECAHTFMPMRASIFASNCSVCWKGMGIGMKCLKCQDCDLKIHEKCRLGAPLPCIPFVHTPQKLKQTSRPRLPDFCPDSQPQIPALLIRCVIALDKGFLNKEGLYRIPGNEAEVTRLMDTFSSRYLPNMSKWDPDIITGCIKKFLGSLREAIIPVSSFKEFARAADNENKEQLTSLVNGLPVPNRDTLSFMCAHLQKVAANSAVNRMTLENLAAVLGQTIVGPIRIIKKPAVQYRGRTTDESEESRQQKNVLLQLLQLDNDFWVKYNEMPLELPPYRDFKRNV